ncbi:nucleotide pyrophosphohydrolase [Cellvibrio sp. pealriver]|uniref:nucleotide pyrophosphohydrolase n=1 Tax=Cellvibrio sp. pealriver TaxID=1622269 RepID=UPI00066FE5C9|nr:nucleotide pyrophosphohydrolase [Cellvibrio sp. pealriver]
MNSLDNLKLALRKFAEERDWDQFHSPKNLSMALAGEAGELLEQFQWLSEDQSKNLSNQKRLAVADEIADIQLYLIRLADKLELDILAECTRKIAINAEKYPIDKSKGKSDKYTNI